MQSIQELLQDAEKYAELSEERDALTLPADTIACALTAIAKALIVIAENGCWKVQWKKEE